MLCYNTRVGRLCFLAFAKNKKCYIFKKLESEAMSVQGVIVKRRVGVTRS